MKNYSVFFVIICLILLNACSSSYKELSNNSFNPSDKFSNYLLKAYKEKADFEAQQMHDWNSAKLYSEKALKAVKGVKIQPEKISYWKISSEKSIELNTAFKNLLIIYEDAIKLDPYNLAKAVSSLDCWAEQQEENWQTWDIKKCKEDFLKSMHDIYNKISLKDKKIKNNKNNSIVNSNDSSLLITKNKENEILQIIYFDFDKSELSQLSKKKINKFININKKFIKKYLIIGHTDTKGTKQYNMELSLKRAHTVKQILLDLDINQEKIKLIAEGEKKLLVKTPDETPHPANRRVEIISIN